jgi:hypothetical protein
LFFANPSYTVSRFDPLLKEIIKFQEFEDDAKENMEEIYKNLFSTNLMDKNTFYRIQMENENFQKIINEKIEEIYNNLTELKNEKITANEFLIFLIKLRFEALVNRAHNLENTYLCDTTPPIDENLYNLWNGVDQKFIDKHKKMGIDIEKKIKQDNALNSEVRKNYTKSYQFIISLIKKPFKFFLLMN